MATRIVLRDMLQSMLDTPIKALEETTSGGELDANKATEKITRCVADLASAIEAAAVQISPNAFTCKDLANPVLENSAIHLHFLLKRCRTQKKMSRAKVIADMKMVCDNLMEQLTDQLAKCQ